MPPTTITARTMSWTPLAATTAAALGAIVVIAAIGDAGGADGIVATTGLAAIALGAGWWIEDDAIDLVGSAPRSLRRRHVERLVLGGPATAAALALVTFVAVTVSPELRDDLVTTETAIRLVAITSAVVALTALLVRRAMPQAALVAAAGTSATYVAWTILTGSTLATTAWLAIAVLAGVGTFAASREPLPR